MLPERQQKNNLSINLTLANFDQLPDSAHVRQPVVEALYACSSATLWRRVKKGQIPAPKKFGARISMWNVGELRENLANLGEV